MILNLLHIAGDGSVGSDETRDLLGGIFNNFESIKAPGKIKSPPQKVYPMLREFLSGFCLSQQIPLFVDT